MTNEELSSAFSSAFALRETDRARLTADFARRKAEEEARLWQVVFRAIRQSQGQLNTALKLSRAASWTAQTLLSKG